MSTAKMYRTVQHQLSKFRQHGSPTGYLMLQFPWATQGKYTPPPTPPTNREHKGATTMLARIQKHLNQYMGEMISYEAEGEGRLFQDMVPNQAMAYTQTSLGSSVELELHVEQAFSKWRPDFLSLACLRGNPEAKTYVFTVQQALKHLTLSETRLLMEPRWSMGVDLSFRQGLRPGETFVEGEERGPVSMLYQQEPGGKGGGGGDVGWVFDQDLMRGLTPEAEDLRLKMVELYKRHRTTLVLTPGDILWIDNRRAVHGRSPFASRFDGTDRFVVRSFVTMDFQGSEAVRKGRMILAKYS